MISQPVVGLALADSLFVLVGLALLLGIALAGTRRPPR